MNIRFCSRLALSPLVPRSPCLANSSPSLSPSSLRLLPLFSLSFLPSSSSRLSSSCASHLPLLPPSFSSRSLARAFSLVTKINWTEDGILMTFDKFRLYALPRSLSASSLTFSCSFLKRFSLSSSSPGLSLASRAIAFDEESARDPSLRSLVSAFALSSAGNTWAGNREEKERGAPDERQNERGSEKSDGDREEESCSRASQAIKLTRDVHASLFSCSFLLPFLRRICTPPCVCACACLFVDA